MPGSLRLTPQRSQADRPRPSGKSRALVTSAPLLLVKRRRRALLLGAGLSVALAATSAGMLLREQIPLTSDQSVPALMALDILREGVHPVFYYGAPQIWAWASHRVRKMRKYVDHVLCKLPFEERWFRERFSR